MEIRELTTLDELAHAAPLCLRVWGDDDHPESKELLLAMVHEGSLCLGCWDGDRLVGYLFGFPTLDSTVQHSHRLAIDPDYRTLGLGAKMKYAQRDWCLERGVTTIRWTYDPARLINARLNLERLGAQCVTYLADYYGSMGGINAGAPSDRLVAAWRLNAARPAPRLDGDVLVELPADFPALLAGAPQEAMEWRALHRAELLPRLSDGWEIVGVEPSGSTAAGSWAYRVRPPTGLTRG